MIKSYVARTTINFIDFEFYVRPGDLLVHDTANHNRLTVYRNGQIVKVVKQEPLGIVAFLKNKFIEAVVAATAPSPVVEAPKVVPESEPVPMPPVEPKITSSKRDKTVAREVPIDEYHNRVAMLSKSTLEIQPELEELAVVEK